MFPTFSIDFVAQDLYTSLACHKSPHQPTSFFMKSHFQLRCYNLSSKLTPFSCLSRHGLWPWGSDDLWKEPWEIKSDHMPLSLRRWRKQENQTVFFFCSCACKKRIKAKKGTKIWGRVKEGGRIKREGKLSHPRTGDSGKVQTVQPVTEHKMSESLELCLQRSAFIEMANQEKTDPHTNIVNWWLWLKYTLNGEKMIFVGVRIF